MFLFVYCFTFYSGLFTHLETPLVMPQSFVIYMALNPVAYRDMRSLRLSSYTIDPWLSLLIPWAWLKNNHCLPCILISVLSLTRNRTLWPPRKRAPLIDSHDSYALMRNYVRNFMNSLLSSKNWCYNQTDTCKCTGTIFEMQICQFFLK